MNGGEAALCGFEALDIRVGTIKRAEPLPAARVAAYKLEIDFGEQLGLRRSSAQVTTHYAAEALIGMQVLGVVNLPPKRIAGFSSEVLVLGVPDEGGHVVLVRPERPIPDGGRLF